MLESLRIAVQTRLPLPPLEDDRSQQGQLHTHLVQVEPLSNAVLHMPFGDVQRELRVDPARHPVDHVRQVVEEHGNVVDQPLVRQPSTRGKVPRAVDPRLDDVALLRPEELQQLERLPLVRLSPRHFTPRASTPLHPMGDTGTCTPPAPSRRPASPDRSPRKPTRHRSCRGTYSRLSSPT